MRNEDATRTVETERGVELRTHKIRVEILRGPMAGRIEELSGPEVKVGSARGADLVIADPTVSRLHAVFRIEGDALRILDAGSRNGTTVDGVRIRDAYARPDSIIGLGSSALRLCMVKEVIHLPLSPLEQFGGLIGRSVAMRRVYALLERVAPTDATVLLEGETGTGKEVAAEAIHAESARARGPVVVFDCGAVSASLIESELFGHERGAFTGASQARVGRFEAAHGGTLFLDEIGELPLELQPKLLRAIEARSVVRLGSNAPRPVDVRIVAATNRQLTREVDRGQFREDLYYRLSVVRVRLPPLRERSEDIPLLVRHFEKEWRSRENPPPPLSDEAIRVLASQQWHGNVRELRNKVDMLLSLGLSELRAAGEGSPPISSEQFDVDVSVPLHVGLARIAEAYKRAYVERVLEASGYNVSQAARSAGVGRAYLQRMMRRFMIGGGRAA